MTEVNHASAPSNSPPWREIQFDALKNMEMVVSTPAANIYKGLSSDLVETLSANLIKEMELDERNDSRNNGQNNGESSNINNNLSSTSSHRVKGFNGNDILDDTNSKYIVIRKPKIRSQESLDRFFHEINLRARHLNDHPNLLPLLAACTKSPPNYASVSVWMEGGCAFDVVHIQGVRFSYRRVLSLALDIAKAVQHMHAKGIVHRDLKTANILLDAEWKKAVVSDFDLAVHTSELITEEPGTVLDDTYDSQPDFKKRHIGRAMGRGPSSGRLKHMVGTLVYLAPEVLRGEPHRLESDVYAFAILLNELASACVPYVDKKLPVPELHTVLETRFSEVTLRAAIVKGLRPGLAGTNQEKDARTNSTGTKSTVPEAFSHIITRAWSDNPIERPSFNEIVEFLEQELDKGFKYAADYSGAVADVFYTSDSSNTRPKSQHSDQEIVEILQQASQPPYKDPAWLISPLAFIPSSSSSYLPIVSAAVSSTGGKRNYMEDRDIIQSPICSTLPDHHLLAVFDGHGGVECSDFVKKYFVGSLVRRWNDPPEITPDAALVHAFEDIDAAFCSQTDGGSSGCTALVALIVKNMLYVANAGDCRAILCRKGEAMTLTTDHKASDPRERARVEARGGFILRYMGSWRVGGQLLVSRALGDKSLKPALSPTPDVTTFELSADDELLILASDGVWDVLTAEEAVSLVRSTVAVPEMAAKRLAMKALELGSADNITVVVCYLTQVSSFSKVTA